MSISTRKSIILPRKTGFTPVGDQKSIFSRFFWGQKNANLFPIVLVEQEGVSDKINGSYLQGEQVVTSWAEKSIDLYLLSPKRKAVTSWGEKSIDLYLLSPKRKAVWRHEVKNQ